MPDFYLTSSAKADMQEIGRYTEKNWGRDQRNIYLRMLDQCFQDLAVKPSMGRNCDDIRYDYYRYKVEKHMIFYRLVARGTIEITRVLHGRMDFERRLPEN